MLDLSKDSLQQIRIKKQLLTLDKCLNFKSGHQTIPSVYNQEAEKFADFQIFHQIKQKDRLFFNPINNMQYFSEIGNQDIDDDSLFDHGANFLANHTNNNHYNSKKLIEKNNNQDKKEDFPMKYLCENVKKSNVSENKGSRYQQILKEQEYVYRKQHQNNNIVSKKLPPCTKTIYSKNIQSSVRLTMEKDKSIELEKNQLGRMNHNKNRLSNEGSMIIQGNASNSNKSKLTKNIPAKTQPQNLNNFQTIQQYLQKLTNKNTNELDSSYENRSKSRLIKKSNGENSSHQCTFKPKILKKSQDMVKNTKNFVERLSFTNQQSSKMPYQPNKIIQSKPSVERIEKLSQPRRLKTAGPEQIQDIPTFKPNLSKKSLQHMSNCTYDVATRNKLWLEQKEEKINKLRKEEQQVKQKKDECTYSPAIKTYKGEQDAQFSRFGRQGMVQYFERLSMAKKKNSIVTFKRQDNMVHGFNEQVLKNKENISFQMNNKEKISVGCKQKKQTYEQAVKILHNKILTLKI